ncbi:hypothetical protein [Roseovarius salinarum]|uniref:hypothetical protein n=1 Tax=Roseovarius salinarum TaxID=1981892 RepID=UPI000C335E95|nr:hypothetical protein [Roseovarius salinarum]
MRILIVGTALLGVAACSPQVPDSGPGFDRPAQYESRKTARDSRVAGQPLAAPGTIATEPLAPGDDARSGGRTAAAPAGDATVTDRSAQGDDGARLAAETRAALAETQANSGEPVVHAAPGNPPPEAVTTASGISRENDFEAVDAERSIEEDAERIARIREQYEVVEPTALPARRGDTGPNIVAYALSTSHPVGTQVYKRRGFNLEARNQRNCAKYPSPDKAQAAFLDMGGPERDRKALDPDGDGYACSWDPEPFRQALGG